jgi:branched-chain amino acid transport system ATP-binding protein
MNVEETEDLAFWITDIKEDKGIAILLVEHNMRFVKSISDRILALNFGVTIAQGRPKEVLEHPEVMKAYLGEEGVSATG